MFKLNLYFYIFKSNEQFFFDIHNKYFKSSLSMWYTGERKEALEE
jgi:hypothetical protein